MKVAELLHRDIITCTDRDSLERVAQSMWEADIGCLPVLGDDGRVVGMITDRDVAIAAFFQGCPLRSIAVSSVMAKEIVTCREADDIRDVARSMRERQIRRVPVVDDGGKLVGMLALSDLARAANDGKVPTGDVTGTLSAISHPRRVLPHAA